MDNAKSKKNLPLMLAGAVAAIVVIYLIMKPRRVAPIRQLQQGQRPVVDPCLKADGTRLPDWVCGAVSLVTPLAKAGVQVYQSKTDLEMQKARLQY